MCGAYLFIYFFKKSILGLSYLIREINYCYTIWLLIKYAHLQVQNRSQQINDQALVTLFIS